jgi:hypothetical protein
MDEEHSTAAVQRYLDELAGDSPSEPVIRALLDRAVRRLHQLCATLLYRSYPRLTRPPVNLQTDELLGAVVKRLLKALREARPASPRQFFALACQHMRWELNDLARRLAEQPPPRSGTTRRWPPRRAVTPASPRTAGASSRPSTGCRRALGDLSRTKRNLTQPGSIPAGGGGLAR